jgi:transcriptional regulator with XRE-family HTH domain
MGTKPLSISAQIRHAREASERLQADIVAETGIAQPTMSKLENGTRTPNVHQLKALAQALNTTFQIGPMTPVP